MRLALTLIAGIGVSLSPAWATRAEDPPKRERPDRARPLLDPSFFDRLDVNKDGVITLDEIPADRRERVAKLIERMDTNGDGKVTREEFEAAVAKFRGRTDRPEPHGPPKQPGAQEDARRSGRRPPSA